MTMTMTMTMTKSKSLALAITKEASFNGQITRCADNAESCARKHADLPALRSSSHRNHAHRRMLVLLRMHGLWRAATSQAGGLLRLLLLWHGAVSPGSAANLLL